MQLSRKAAPLLGLATLAALGLAAALPAQAQNAVTNGDFEANTSFIPTGYFNFFGSVPSVAGQGVGGSNAADFDATQPFTLLDQGGPNGSAPIHTVVGDTYVFTYSVKGAGTPDSTFGYGTFNARIGPAGGGLSGPANAITSDTYTTFSSNYVATTPQTEISFSANFFGSGTGANHLYLDNVSLRDITTPEPSSVAAFAFMGLGAMGLILKARRRRTA